MRALTVDNILMKKRSYVNWTNQDFTDAFANPEDCGVWFIWGNSGSGKSSFLMELIKALSVCGKIVFNGLEEGDSESFRKKLIKHKITELKKNIIIVQETLPQLEARLDKRNSPKVVVIDSFQYFGINYKEYLRFKEKYKSKIIIINSHCDGKQPSGRAAKSVMYDAYMKIWIEGYKAFGKGREIGENGGIYTIWHEGAERYWGEL